MKIPWYKYLLSYFYLVKIKDINSEFNPGLCLQMEAGKLLLNTNNANYSYGNMHTVFEEAFELCKIEEFPPKNLLILGLGTGSVIDILQRQYGLEPKITAVEIDPAVINCLQYWEQLQLQTAEIICGDAFKVVNDIKDKFDLIIVDLFIDLDVSAGIHDLQFFEQLKQLLNVKGTILVNYVVDNAIQKSQFEEFQLVLMKYFKELRVHKLQRINRILELKAPL